MKKVLIVIAVLIIIFFAGLFVSYKLTNSGKKQSAQSNETDIYTSIPVSSNKEEKKEEKVEEKEYKEINKDSQVAQDIYEFIPKSFQTYPGKTNNDYMIYEALTRLSKDENVKKGEIKGMASYNYDDVNDMIKKIYGESMSAEKREVYSCPIEYFEKENAFCLYPVGIDKTDNMMVIKSVEENDKFFKITVYSVCVYMDLEKPDSKKLYVMTKDTMKKYYSLISRNDKSLINTYKEYTLEGSQLDPTKVVEKLEKDLPLIEYYLVKTNDKENKYYVSDIKDIY